MIKMVSNISNLNKQNNYFYDKENIAQVKWHLDKEKSSRISYSVQNFKIEFFNKYKAYGKRVLFNSSQNNKIFIDINNIPNDYIVSQ